MQPPIVAGFYTAQYYVTIAGEYDLSVFLQGGTGLVGTPQTTQVTINPSSFDHGSSTAEGQGLLQGTAGTQSSFEITAKDIYNNQLTDGGLVFSVHIRGPSFILGQVTDTSDGKYTVSFEPVIRGEYRVDVMNQGEPVPCKEIDPYVCESVCINPAECDEPCPECLVHELTSDWLFNCSAAVTAADKTFAYGQGLATGIAAQTVQQEFYVRALDKFGIEQADGGDAQGFDISIKEEMLGTELSAVAPYQPLNTKFRCLAEAPSWKYYWNAASGRCFKTVKNFSLTDENDQGDGSYKVMYSVTQSGAFALHVTFNNGTGGSTCSVMNPTTGTHTTPTMLCGGAPDGVGTCCKTNILGSPFSLVVEPGPLSPAHCEPVNLEQLSIFAGEPAVVLVQTKDEFGNNGR